MLSLEEGKKFVRLARNSIRMYFTNEEVDLSNVKKFSDKQGVFVTLNKRGMLRGCIGYPEPIMPLYKAVVQAARSAALSDPRFPPLTEKEINEVTVEVSVLTVPELIEVKDAEEYLDKIKIGRDGLIVRAPFGSGLLLPQVFPEYNAKPRLALEMTCQKAGLPRNYYKDVETCKIFKFQAQIFSEEEPNGNVVEKKE
ncbi:MAG: TIGR00296 family protein [Nanoarchaeota archaeon]|nr:TIGR00296 family protein [Nanoarchaeota archaeon]